nr:hypothetical protein [Seonamhaeicola sp. ML3]
MGGYNKTALNTIESYNIKTGNWNTDGKLFYGIASPALTFNNSIIYIYDKGSLLTYNTNTKTLNEYKISIQFDGCAMHYYNDKIYLIGGYVENEYSRSSANKIISIDLDEFENTKIYRSKTLVSTNP